jgi:hypothetical protein
MKWGRGKGSLKVRLQPKLAAYERSPVVRLGLTRRAIVGAEKTGSITRLEARNAFRAVKKAKSGSAARRPLSAAVIERYLWHFGVGPSKTLGQNGSGVKKGAVAKSAAGKRSKDRRAS